jgi:hypothetical protein
MSGDFEKKIEELFLGEKKSLSLNELNSLITDSFSNIRTINEQKASFDSAAFYENMPKIPLAENVIGLKDSTTDQQSRNTFTTLLNQIIGSGRSLEEKFNILNSFIDNPPDAGGMSVAKILNYIMFLRVLNSLVYDYQGGTAGGLHEAFVAGITGGSMLQTNNNLDDVMTTESEISLKLLRSDTSAQGSIKLLLDKLSSNKKIEYYIGFKTVSKKQLTGGLNYYKIIITPENFKQITNITNTLNLKADSSLEDIKNAYKTLRDTQQLKTYNFTIFKEEIKKQKLISLNISKEKIIKFIDSYHKVLQEDINAIYKNLAELSNNINNFYYSSDQKTASYATQGATNSSNITRALNKVSKK